MDSTYHAPVDLLYRSELLDVSSPLVEGGAHPTIAYATYTGNAQHYIQLSAAWQETEGCRLVACVAPSQSPQSIGRYAVRRYIQHIEAATRLRHLLTPHYLLDITRLLQARQQHTDGDTTIDKHPMNRRAHYRHPSPYGLYGAWQPLAPIHPFDWRTRATSHLDEAYVNKVIFHGETPDSLEFHTFFRVLLRELTNPPLPKGVEPFGAIYRRNFDHEVEKRNTVEPQRKAIRTIVTS